MSVVLTFWLNLKGKKYFLARSGQKVNVWKLWIHKTSFIAAISEA